MLSLFGNLIGSLIVAEWFPGSAEDGLLHDTRTMRRSACAQLIGIGIVVAVWAFNVFGVKPSLILGYVTGALLMFPLVVFIILPYFSGDWVSSNIKFEDVASGGEFSLGRHLASCGCSSCVGPPTASKCARPSHPSTTTRSGTRRLALR